MASERFYGRALLLEYFTVGYNILEAAASVIFGAAAGSIALIGFGLDSIVESLSGLVLMWRLKQHGSISEEREEEVERRAARFVSVTFFILGLYILFESIKKLVTGEAAQHSLAGIIIAVASLIVMPLLARFKYNIGRKIGSQALVADSKETMVCALLSVALLLGLGANYLFGFWQADPLAGIVIVFFLFREGWEGWNESDEESEI